MDAGRRLLFLSSAACAAMTPWAAYGQDVTNTAPPPSEQASDGEGDIVVTATRRSESVNSVAATLEC